MKRVLALCSIVALIGCDGRTVDPLASAAEARTPMRAQSPTVVELYQSQGCSSCPPAIVNVNALAGRTDVLPLMFAVTYWDRLGWKDTASATRPTPSASGTMPAMPVAPTCSRRRWW